MTRHTRHSGRFNRFSPKNDGPEQINSILGSSFSSLGIAAKIKEHNLKKAWAECVGAGIAKRAVPLRLIGTVLHCTVATSAWMTELVYQKSALTARLNSRLGAATVTDIVFKVGPVTPYGTVKPPAPKAPRRELTPQESRFIEDTTSGIKDERLKEAIVRAFSRSRS